MRALLLLSGATTAGVHGALHTQRVWPYVGFGLVLLLYLGATTFTRRPEKGDSGLAMVIMAGDLLLITVAVWLTGNPQSEYYLL